SGSRHSRSSNQESNQGGEGGFASSSSSSPLSYSAVLRGAHVCRRFANLIVLRHPTQRLRSHLLFLAATYSQLYEPASLAAAFAPGHIASSPSSSSAPSLPPSSPPSLPSSSPSSSSSSFTAWLFSFFSPSPRSSSPPSSPSPRNSSSLPSPSAPSSSPAARWWRRLAPPLFDNYLVRSLGGEGVFALPPGSLAGGGGQEEGGGGGAGEEGGGEGRAESPYLALARTMLAQYDVILVLESPSAAVDRSSRWGLGWSAPLAAFHSRNTSKMVQGGGKQEEGEDDSSSGSGSGTNSSSISTDSSNIGSGGSAIQAGIEGANSGGIGSSRGEEEEEEEGVFGGPLAHLLPAPAVLRELEADAVRHDMPLYEYGRLLAGLDDVVWRAAAEELGDP
ncbi:hypothetical protein Agub_g5358, partial [Astrephomene gubernaculifera]